MIKNQCLINQISVFLKNQPGNLYTLIRLLANNKINLRALSLTETHDFGAARLIVDNSEACVNALNEMHYIFLETDVLAVEVNKIPRGMADMLETFAVRELNIEYAYTIFKKKKGSAVIIIRVPNPTEACESLQARGITLLTKQDIASL
jgi:hypothetical protein